MAAHKKEDKGLATAGPSDSDSALWAECMLQTYFTAKGQIDYFVVIEQEDKKEDNS